MAGVVTKRIIIACLLGAVLFFPGQGQGQQLPGTGALIGVITLDSLTHFMNIHTDIRLTFNAGKINGRRSVRFPGRAYDLNGLLAHIQKSTGLTWSIYEKHVIFRDAPHRTRPTAIRKKTIMPRKVADDTPAAVVHPKSATSSVSLAPIIPSASPISAKIPTSSSYRSTNIASLPSSQSTNIERPSSSKWLVHAGVFANEVMYVNGGIEAGIKPLSLLFSIGSNFHVTTWHIGLQSGALFRLPPWHISYHVTAGYSPLSAFTNVDSGRSQIRFNVKGQLYDLGIAAYNRHGKHWLFKVGVEWRLLRTSYYKDGKLTAPEQYFAQGQDPDKTLYLLHPPLKIVNTFDRNSSTNIKVWPGISIGIYYDFLR